MRRVKVSEFGSRESLTVTTDSVPEPAPHEALVRIHAAGVNPYDWMTRAGNGANVDLPWIPGWDFSGVMTAVGNDVTGLHVDDAVFGMLADERGTYTEYAAIPGSNLVRKPQTVSHTVAAGAPMAALTAWQALFDVGRLRPTQRVLIHAAAGGVGHLAVQLADWIGAYTIGTASASNEAYLDDIGLDEFINYREEQFEDIVSPVDLVIDAVGGDIFERSIEVLRTDGHIAKLSGPLTTDESDLLARSGVSGSYPVVQWRPEQLRTIARFLEEDELDVRIDSVQSLDSVEAAHRRSESGHARGKIILDILAE